MASTLTEIDSLEIQVIVDNELDPISKYIEPVTAYGNLAHIGLASPKISDERGSDIHELKMENICCGAHGLSLLITATREGERRSVLFDTGPEEDIWERNASRLGVKLDEIETIVLSHWHRDHSGGMLRVIKLIKRACESANKRMQLIIDLHSDRPKYRGFKTPMGLISLQADPTFNEIHQAGGLVETSEELHTILDNMFLVSGEIPRQTSYELGLRRGMRFDDLHGWTEDELIRDERFLMCKLKDRGIVVFTGCGHAGVVNTITEALKLGEGVGLHGVIGGFHLADAETPQLNDTARDIAKSNPKILLPGHCTGWRAKYVMEKEMPGKLAPSTVGTKFTFA